MCSRMCGLHSLTFGAYINDLEILVSRSGQDWWYAFESESDLRFICSRLRKNEQNSIPLRPFGSLESFSSLDTLAKNETDCSSSKQPQILVSTEADEHCEFGVLFLTLFNGSKNQQPQTLCDALHTEKEKE